MTSSIGSHLVLSTVLCIALVACIDDGGRALWRVDRISDDERELGLTVTIRACDAVDDAVVEQRSDEVSITVKLRRVGSRMEGVGCDDDVAFEEPVVVELDEPLGGRRLLGCTAQPRQVCAIP